MMTGRRLEALTLFTRALTTIRLPPIISRENDAKIIGTVLGILILKKNDIPIKQTQEAATPPTTAPSAFIPTYRSTARYRPSLTNTKTLIGVKNVNRTHN